MLARVSWRNTHCLCIASSTIFAYGQTGSGKTHTILGPKDGLLVKPEEEGGIISRVIDDIYKEAATMKARDDPPLLTASFVEIYMEQIRDLLVATNSANSSSSASASMNGGLKIRESAQKGVYIEDMTQVACASAGAMMELVRTGTLNRAVASTRMNKDSSRSHSILMITSKAKTARSTMYIVDLAGSELVNKTNASGRVLQEAKAINKSLSALSNVIKALGDGKKHVPYRDSKLSRLLQDSLGGTAKTCLILAASCSSFNMPETISTLRFGLRAKEIKNPVTSKQETSSSGGSGGFGPGGVFKELYQQAMTDMDEKNRKIDELQRLLSAAYQESAGAQPEEQEQDAEQHDNAPTQQDCSAGDNSSGHDEESSGGQRRRLCDRCACQAEEIEAEVVDQEDAGDVCSPLQQVITQREQLEQANQALEEENTRLFAVLEALESRLDQVVVDFSSGRPVLSRRGSSTAGEEDANDVLSLKMWVQSETWQQALELRPETDESPAQSTSSAPGSPAKLTLEAVAEADHLEPLELAACANCTDSVPCVHRTDAEALSRQIVELKLQLHYLSESTKLSLEGEHYQIVLENARLKTRVEELEFQANLCTVTCSQLEMKNRACETRLSNQETHISCLQNSLQEYQGLFKQQIIMSQEKCRLLSDELEFYKKLAKYSTPSPSTSPRRTQAANSFSASSSNTGLPSPQAVSPSRKSPMIKQLSPQESGAPAFGLWRGFSGLYKPPKLLESGDERCDFAQEPLTGKAQRMIVKPVSSRQLEAERAATTANWKPKGAAPSSLAQLLTASRTASSPDLRMKRDEAALLEEMVGQAS